MAIFYANTFDDDPLGEAAVLQERCFLCGEAITFPLVMWMGATAEIFLHEECAPSFVLRLAHDCWGLQRNRSHNHINADGELTL